MEQYRLAKSELKSFLELLKEDYQKIIGPGVDEEDRSIFKEITNINDLKLENTNPLKPPKEFLFPQKDNLFNYSCKENTIEINIKDTTEKQVLFALRPCDLAAIYYTDTFFKNNFLDNYYSQKRENTLIIGISCEYPSNKCFCTSMDISPTSSNGADIFLTNGGSFFLTEFISEKGNLIKEKLKSILTESVQEDNSLKEKIDKNTRSLLLEEFNLKKVRENLEKAYTSEDTWKKYSDACIVCGACTFDCPTCTCFDVNDSFLEKDTGIRYRTWDSCSFYNFSLHASGHNPRGRKVDRLRQRIMHKFNYTVKQFNLLSCVGCGRCIAVCPVGINTRSIVKDFEEALNEDK